jgi:hypothetical protein
MSHIEIVEIAMPDGAVISAEVSVANSITDAGAQSRLNLSASKESLASIVRGTVSGLGFHAEDDGEHIDELDSAPPGMKISTVSGEATAVVKVDSEQVLSNGSHR